MQSFPALQDQLQLRHCNTNYTSCIKIAGIPILPPLITDENRIELSKYKAKAVYVEHKLQRKREEHNQCLQQHGRLSNVDLNTSSDSSGIFSKSINSSNKEVYKNYSKQCSSELQSEFCDEASTVYDTITNFSGSDSSPDLNNPVICDRLSSSNTRTGNRNLQSDSDNDRPVNKSVVRNLDAPSIETIHHGVCDDDRHLLEKRFSSSSTVFDQDDDVNVLENSEISTTSDGSVLKMLPENNTCDIADVNIRNNQQNLNLSPCKDLVLKSDVLTAIGQGNVTVRGKKRDFNVSKEFSMFDSIVQKDNHDFSLSEIDNLKNDQEKNGCEDIKVVDCSNKNEKNVKTPPKLVRQNSYTLDSPSPELLAFVERQQKKGLNHKPELLKRTHTWTITSDENQNKNSTDFKPFKSNKDNIRKSRKAWNIEETKQQWSKEKADLNSRVIRTIDNKLKQRNKINDVNNYEIPPKTKVQAHSSDCVYSLMKDIHSAGILVDSNSINIINKERRNTGSPVDKQKPRKREIILSPISLKAHDSSQIGDNMHNLDDISTSNDGVLGTCRSTLTLTPEKDVAYDSNHIHDVPYSACSSVSGDSALINTSLKNSLNTNDDSVSMCSSSVSLNKFMLALHNDKLLPSDIQADPMLNDLKMKHHKQIEELLRQQNEELESLISSRPSTATSYVNSSPPIISSHNYHDSLPAKHLVRRPIRLSNEPASAKARRCFRQLNFNANHRKCPLEYTEEERKAAAIITAYAKGYLVRRLFKTERVQQIIKSITDSMQCALNFDYSNEGNWTQADVDLHKRLIVQVESASFAFREVFDYPTATKMAIIRADRLKKRMPRSQPDKPALSDATKRVIMRKKMQPQTIAKSNPSERAIPKQRRRRRSFTGFSNITISSRSVQPTPLQKSASTGATNRQPWK